MKKIFCLVLLIIINQPILSHMYELKIYPEKVNKVAVLVTIIAEAVSLGWLGLIGLTVKNQIKEGKLKDIHIPKILQSSVPGVVGVIYSSFALNSFYKWHNRRHQPILIFDEEGFTYEKPMGLFKGRKYTRYLWEDVISHWVTGVVNESGGEIRKSWYYHIKGEEDIVEINVMELDIPRELRAKVESLRMGNIQALMS